MSSIKTLKPLHQRLRLVRLQLARTSRVSSISRLLILVCALLVIQAAADWEFVLPSQVRVLVLTGDLVLLGYLIHRWLILNWRMIGEESAALLIEQRWPQLRQSLISYIDFSKTPPSSDSGQLVKELEAQVGVSTRHFAFNEVVPFKPACLLGIAAGCVVICTLWIVCMTWPISLALLERIILRPVACPTKTLLIPITHNLTVGRGSDVTLSAQAGRIVPIQGRLEITPQSAGSRPYGVEALPDSRHILSQTLPAVQESFQYQFRLGDALTPPATVNVLEPPSIEQIHFKEIFPVYTQLPPEDLVPSDLAPLAGSHLKISATSTRPIREATLHLCGSTTRDVPLTVDSAGKIIEGEIEVPVKDLEGLSIHLVDAEGIGSQNDTVYPIGVVRDKAPEIKVLRRIAKTTMTLRAKPLIKFHVNDDFGIRHLYFHYVVSREPDEGQAGPFQVRECQIELPLSDGKDFVSSFTLDLANQDPELKEEDIIIYDLTAIDNNNVTGPSTTVSEHQRIRIISQQAKAAEIAARTLRRAAQIDDLAGDELSFGKVISETVVSKTPSATAKPEGHAP